MTAESAHRQQTLSQDMTGGITSRVERYNLYKNKPAEADIRVYSDGLLIAKCRAKGIGPGKLFVTIDPFHHPVNSRLALTFVNPSSQLVNSTRLMATVISRSLQGIELKLDPHTG